MDVGKRARRHVNQIPRGSPYHALQSSLARRHSRRRHHAHNRQGAWSALALACGDFCCGRNVRYTLHHERQSAHRGSSRHIHHPSMAWEQSLHQYTRFGIRLEPPKRVPPHCRTVNRSGCHPRSHRRSQEDSPCRHMACAVHGRIIFPERALHSGDPHIRSP